MKNRRTDAVGCFAVGVRTGVKSIIRFALARDVSLTVDSGTLSAWPRHTVTGRKAVAGVLATFTRRGLTVQQTRVNNAPGMVLRLKGQVIAVIVARVSAWHIAELWVITNPDKLSAWKPTREP